MKNGEERKSTEGNIKYHFDKVVHEKCFLPKFYQIACNLFKYGVDRAYEFHAMKEAR